MPKGVYDRNKAKKTKTEDLDSEITEVTRKKRTKRSKKLQIEEKEKEWKWGLMYTIFVDPPEDLLVKREHIGKYLECAGESKKLFKLVEVHDNSSVTAVDDELGCYKTLPIDRVILHRNEEIRNQIKDTDRMREKIDFVKTKRKIRRKSIMNG